MKVLLVIFTVVTCVFSPTVFSSPLELLTKNDIDNQWITYQVPAQENTRSMCCWGHSSSIRINGETNLQFKFCDLGKSNHGYGTSNKSPLTKNINIYVKLKQGEVTQILSVGDGCQVKKLGQEITWIKGVNQETSLDFLTVVAQESKQEVSEDALYALSHHKSHQASVNLYELASHNNKELAKNAVFWLGQTRKNGVKYLKKLYNELAVGEVKQHINFSLSQANNQQGDDLLQTIALTDENEEQRSEALFWLAQNNPKKAKQIIFTLLENNDNKDDQEEAVFTLSQLEDGLGVDGLFEIIQGSYPKSIKKKALFWLSQSDNPKVIERLQAML